MTNKKEQKLFDRLQTLMKEEYKDSREIMNILDQGIEKYPKNCYFPYYAGLFYQEFDIEEACDYYERSIEIQPAFPEPYFRLCDLRWNEDQIEENVLKIIARYTLNPSTGRLEHRVDVDANIFNKLNHKYVKNLQYNKLKHMCSMLYNLLEDYFNHTDKVSYEYLELYKNVANSFGASIQDSELSTPIYRKAFLKRPDIDVTTEQLRTLFKLDFLIAKNYILARNYTFKPDKFPTLEFNQLYNVSRVRSKPTVELIVSGIGGSGTTYFMQCLKNQGYKVNHYDDLDGIKHTPYPPLGESIKKGIYLYGNPRRAIYSLYDRMKNPTEHFAKFSKPHKHNTGLDGFMCEVVLQYYVKNKEINQLTDQDLADIDLIGYYQQFLNWTKGTTYPIFFLDMARFDEVKEELYSFLETNEDSFEFKFDPEKYHRHDQDIVEIEKDQTEYSNIYQLIYQKMSSVNGMIKNPIDQEEQQNTDKKLRIGIFSPDLNFNAVGLFMTPFLKLHNKDKFEIFCYYNSSYEDNHTEKFREYIGEDHWFNINGAHDLWIYNLVKSHSIDILLDLIGPGTKDKFELMSMKPCEIMINFLGYPSTYILDEFDYRITDRTTDPNQETLTEYSEKVVYMPRLFLCYHMFESSKMIDIGYNNHSPMIRIGIINKFIKHHILIRQIWRKLINKHPNCQFIIKTDGLSGSDESYKIYENIDQIKIINYLEDPSDYYKLFYDFDFCVDTFPYSGTTTTCGTFLMGVPLFTIYNEKNRHVSNVSGSILKQCTDLDQNRYICKNLPDYFDSISAEIERLTVEKARENYRSEELERRTKLRNTFLERMDPVKYTREFEELLMKIYEDKQLTIDEDYKNLTFSE